ncbi:unnamed protein product [Timema podura]|uniref:DhaK domain-containing protein n=1 Tax=Timema podura TaxID=61482 RepID=A0ABN7NGG0_TIMPD|nr:unnamed protein product [Timema podura]
MSTGKKLINTVDTCVADMLSGITLALPGLSLHTSKRVILVNRWANRGDSVGLISGGGSGHEPFCAVIKLRTIFGGGPTGYVGGGMLTAAVAGSVFASPPSSSVLHAIRKVGQGTTAGTLVIIANYTGDILNFGLAVEWAKNEGLKVESMVVGEDCALLSQDGTTNSSTGRRGMCGLLFVYKITGAMSEEGKSLREIKATAIEVNNSMATIGVSLSACSLPGSGPLFQVAADEMELGLGVHGEAGKQKLKVT